MLRYLQVMTTMFTDELRLNLLRDLCIHEPAINVEKVINCNQTLRKQASH
jgi:hypothetical protein